ncbi:MAG: hypothetical protein LM590_00910 [Thermofilum sp.]|jgi:hypothetical protein|nr:hypothetical protein [Thermofilum sp.]
MPTALVYKCKVERALPRFDQKMRKRYGGEDFKSQKYIEGDYVVKLVEFWARAMELYKKAVPDIVEYLEKEFGKLVDVMVSNTVFVMNMNTAL